MKTITIARISGEFINDEDDVCSYLQPHTGFDPLSWIPYNKAKVIFDKLDFNSLLIDHGVDEFFRSKIEMEEEILENFVLGYKPNVILFTFEIPEYIWKNKKKFAEESGYDDDVMGYITDYTGYDWDCKEEKEIKIPDNLIEFYDCFNWIQENHASLQIKYMEFLVETGGDEELTENEFYMFIAKNAREIVDL